MCLFQRYTGQRRGYGQRGVSASGRWVPLNPRSRSKPGVHKMSEHTHVDGIYPFPAVTQTRTIETNGTSIHVRVGGHGPAVVMLHGFGTTGDMWGHLASALIEDHMIVAPDLRGLGLSSKPDGGYDKKNLASDPGIKSHGIRPCGTLASVVRTWSAWSPAASASISTASGTNFPGTRSGLMKRSASIMRRSMRRASFRCRSWPWVAKLHSAL